MDSKQKDKFRNRILSVEVVSRLCCTRCNERVWVNQGSAWLVDKFLDDHWGCGGKIEHSYGTDVYPVVSA